MAIPLTLFIVFKIISSSPIGKEYPKIEVKDKEFETREKGAVIVSDSTKMFSRIFVSYAREDKYVVESVESILKTLDSVDFRWDLQILRSGDDWEKVLLEEIEAADSFQLFWSEHAKVSQNVKNEWTYALGLKRDHFIRPVYWNEPMPEPPEELNRFHFAKIRIGM